MSEQWRKRVWYSDERDANYDRRIGRNELEGDWTYTKRFWKAAIDEPDLRVMVQVGSRRITVITYERL